MQLSWRQIELAAAKFANEWKDARYEKPDTQSFYNDFFNVFGVSRRRVARFEELVHLQPKKLGYIDLLWPGILIVEQKSTGRDLKKASTQAAEYFDALSDDQKPRFQLVCDFQIFELLDRDTRQRVSFKLADLPKYVRHFAFMIGKQNPKVRVQEHLNHVAADYVVKIYHGLVKSGYPQEFLESLLTRLVFCLFADNTGIFQPRGCFIDFIESRSRVDGSDLGNLLSHLFQILNTPLGNRQTTLDPDLAEFPYIAGGIFEDQIPIASLDEEIRKNLLSACEFDWSEISPAIFGSLYQSVLSNKQRRDIGAYSTAENNVLKILDDLFLKSIRGELAEIKKYNVGAAGKLKALLEKLSHFTFLDPACGCGNFLVIAYRELRELELEILLELDRCGALKNISAKKSVINVDQFYGIEKQTYSAKIAKAAMWMTDHIANNSLSSALNVDFNRIPLKASSNIVVCDALSFDWEMLISAKNCSFIVGNPPYKGPKQQSLTERETLAKLAKLPPNSGTLDLVCGWLLKSAKYANAGTQIGLVTINSIVQGEQIGQLWPILFTEFALEITFAHQPFQWYSDSHCSKSQVQVVILGLSNKNTSSKIRLLYCYATAKSKPVALECAHISPYLIPGDNLIDPHTVVAESSKPLNSFKKLRTGTKPIDGGYYILDEAEKATLLYNEPEAEKFLRPFIGGDEFLKGETRYLLVVENASPSELKKLPTVRKLIHDVAQYRKAEISAKGNNRKLKQPNELYKEPKKFHITSLPTKPFLVIPEVTSERRDYVPIGYLRPPNVPSNLVKYLEDASLAQFALLTSATHMAWLKVIGGRLEGRYRYSIGIVYNTFPLPDIQDQEKLCLLGEAIIEARKEAAAQNFSLADMYDPNHMPHKLRMAHRALDRVVDLMYLGHKAASDMERVADLLNRYQSLIVRPS